MQINKAKSEHLIALAIADKTAQVGIKAFINTSRPASTNDLIYLLGCIRSGKYTLRSAHKDNKGFWHFITLD